FRQQNERPVITFACFGRAKQRRLEAKQRNLSWHGIDGLCPTPVGAKPPSRFHYPDPKKHLGRNEPLRSGRYAPASEGCDHRLMAWIRTLKPSSASSGD